MMVRTIYVAIFCTGLMICLMNIGVGMHRYLGEQKIQQLQLLKATTKSNNKLSVLETSLEDFLRSAVDASSAAAAAAAGATTTTTSTRMVRPGSFLTSTTTTTTTYKSDDPAAQLQVSSSVSSSDSNRLSFSLASLSSAAGAAAAAELDRLSNNSHFVRPPLESIVQGKWNITGDPGWLLDFAVIGFPKCGTSSLMHLLGGHHSKTLKNKNTNPLLQEVHMFPDERCELGYNQQAKLIRELYHEFPTASYIKRGIKCPSDLENTALSLPNYETYFPTTKFIVGIRHPVLWFESFYNFRIHNQFPMPPAEKLMGPCRKGFFSVCTFRANFHLFLSHLGKTNLASDGKEQVYFPPDLQPYLRHVNSAFGLAAAGRNRSTTTTTTTTKPLLKLTNQVFLYELSQLRVEDDEEIVETTTNHSSPPPEKRRSVQFREDLQSFLGLTTKIGEMIWYKPGIKHEDEDTLHDVNSMKMDICDSKYDELRATLMVQAIDASRWIRHYFMHGRDVVVSSPEYLKEILVTWEDDPCIQRRQKQQEQQLVRQQQLKQQQQQLLKENE